MSSPSVRFEPRRVRWQAGVLSGLVYSIWACLRNWEAGWALLALIIGTQFAVSFIATLLFSTVLLALIGKSKNQSTGLAIGLIVAALYAILLCSAHLVAGTPHLLATVLPIITIASLYALWFSTRIVAANNNLVDVG